MCMDAIKFKAFLLVLCSVAIFSCGDEEEPKRVETLDPDPVNNTEVLLKAKFDLPAGVADEFGFVWDGLPSPDYTRSYVVALGTSEIKGEASTVLRDLDQEQNYYVRAFYRKGTSIIYGKEKTFVFGGYTPEINEILPESAHWADTVTIIGQNFSCVNTMSVEFGSLIASVISCSADTLRCVVPSLLPSGSHQVIVKVHNKPSEGTAFTLSKPVISHFTPVEATFLDLVTINGENFHTDPSRNKVRFGSQTAEVLQASATSLQVRVPLTIGEPDPMISVQVDSQRVDAQENFSLLRPAINSVEPIAERIGNIITISGENFNPSRELNEVLFETNNAEVIEASDTELKVRVPNGPFISRKIKLSVKVANMVVDISMLFTIQDAWLRKADITAGQFGRWGGQGFTINDVGYAGLGGGAGVSSAYQDFYRFNEETNLWTPIADFGGGKRYWTASFVIDDVAYVGTGSVTTSGEGTNDFYKYNVQEDTWSRIADFPGIPVTHAVGFAINGKGYLCLPTQENNFWEYDPSLDSWTEKSTLVTSPWGGYKKAVGAFVLKGRAFVVTSLYSYGELYEYDHVNDSWTAKNTIADMGNFPAVISTASHAYYQVDYRMIQYDIDTDSWNSVDFYPVPSRNDTFFFSIGEKLFIGGGRENSYKDFWECDTSMFE
jgi:N-acetylneuraminic acid mutarotase